MLHGERQLEVLKYWSLVEVWRQVLLPLVSTEYMYRVLCLVVVWCVVLCRGALGSQALAFDGSSMFIHRHLNFDGTRCLDGDESDQTPSTCLHMSTRQNPILVPSASSTGKR